MTANDQVNSLATIQLAEVFDSAKQFQLVPEPRQNGHEKPVAGHLTARMLFDKKATWKYLEDRHAAGAIIKKTPITEDFTAESYRNMYGDSAIPLFVYSAEAERIKVCEADNPPDLEPGQVLISLIDPPAEVEPESLNTQHSRNQKLE